MNKTKHAIVVTLLAIMEKGGAHYTITSINRLRELLILFHEASVERRWLFQCLRDLIDAGLISRQPRYRQNEEGAIRQMSSMIAFTIKGLKYMTAKKIEGARKLLSRMIAWLKNKDKRFPRDGQATRNSAPLENERNLKRLKRLISEVG